MAIACFIRYRIDPFQRDAFREYAREWGRIIPRCRGDPAGRANFAFAQEKRFILREERTFCENVEHP